MRASRRFLASPQGSIELQASPRCPLLPDAETLRVFRFVKTRGSILTQRMPGEVLQVSGRPELLARYIESFKFEPEMQTGHRHPEQAFVGELEAGSNMIIVEADDDADDLNYVADQ
jgi:hypothetical protein